MMSYMDAVAHPLSILGPSVLLSSLSVGTFIAQASILSFYCRYIGFRSTSYGLTIFSEMLVVGILESVGFMPMIGYQSHRLLTTR